ncbi:MAG: hypothetical protein ABSF29_17200 [Tepidisphaeraceae bacterium]|jgi:hypothetical protein
MDSKQTLSEISHLFLSEIRQRPGAGAPRPTRVPPAAPAKPAAARAHASVDLTPEELAAAYGEDSSEAATTGLEFSVVLASHLTDPSQRIRQYAGYLAAQNKRVGLIEIDNTDFSIAAFESGPRDGVADAASSPIVEELDARRMSETLAEMSFDIDRWLICLTNPRTTEARELLRVSRRWVLLTTADHEGIVAAYRALKGLSELGKPSISAAVLNARDEAEAEAVFNKLDAVAGQFLGCRITAQAPVQPADQVSEQLILHCRAPRDKSQPLTGPQWHVVADFLSRAAAPAAPKRPESPLPTMKIEPAAPARRPAAPIPIAQPALNETPAEEVVDLIDDGEDSVLEAIVNRGGAAGEWVQCPLKPPMCPQAVLAVGRDHRLVLVAVAGRGLSQLRPIGLALKWMNENSDLIRMALPQLAIEASLTPSVRLLVDWFDLSAEQLQPLVHSQAVTVQAYRRIKWGQKRGLLLEAA